MGLRGTGDQGVAVRRSASGRREKARLAAFFVRLAAKERVAPALHVRPLVAELFLTENCNLRCISCSCWRDATRGELTTEEWKGVLDQLVELRVLKVNFTGGEPLTRQDCPELIAYAAARGFRHLHLNTNAVLLDDRRRAEVLAAGVRSFNVSVDGPDAAVHDRVRGRAGAFAATVGHLEALLAERQRLGLRVRMNFTVMRSNVSSLPDVARLAQRLGVRLYLNLATDRTFLFRDGQVTIESKVPGPALEAAMAELEGLARADRRHLPRYSDLAYVRRHFAEVVQAGLPCAESQLKLLVHSTGGVGGCWAHDPERNVRQLPLRQIVDGRHYRDQHARLFRKDCVGCGSNYSLNLRWRPGTYAQDALWRLGRRSLVAAHPRRA